MSAFFFFAVLHVYVLNMYASTDCFVQRCGLFNEQITFLQLYTHNECAYMT